MNAPTSKLAQGLFARWMGLTTSATPQRAPLQLVALEDRVLYSAGPIPAEVMDADLVSQGDSDGVDASDLGLNSIEMAATDTLEYLQQQVDEANSLDSMDDIQPMEIVPGDLGDASGDGDLSGVDTSAEQFSETVDQIAEDDAVATDLSSVERVTAAASFGFGNGPSISGRIFNDINGDGSIDEDVGLGGVNVLLINSLTRLSIDTETDELGNYEFTGLVPGQTYFIVVESTTLGNSLEFNEGYSADDVWGEQTYAAAGALFENSDDSGFGVTDSDGAFYSGFNNESDIETFAHLIQRDVEGEDFTNVDFGFSFNVVTNTNAGGNQDDDLNSNRTVQGSLRQFIANANAIAGDNAMRFVPVEDETYTSQASNSDIWLINVTKALPNIVDAGTTISGLTYQTNGLLYEPPEADVTPEGTANGVGVFDALVGPDLYSSFTLKGPLDASPNEQFAGLVIEAANVQVSNLSVVNFETGIVVKGADSSNVSIVQNFIGAHSDGTNGEAVQTIGITVEVADEGTISNNFILNSETTGVLINGFLASGDQAENWTITNNYIADLQDAGNDFADGIGLTGGTQGALIFNNRIENANEFGIDLFNNRGAVTITNNAITDSGHDSVVGQR